MKGAHFFKVINKLALVFRSKFYLYVKSYVLLSSRSDQEIVIKRKFALEGWGGGVGCVQGKILLRFLSLRTRSEGQT